MPFACGPPRGRFKFAAGWFQQVVHAKVHKQVHTLGLRTLNRIV